MEQSTMGGVVLYQDKNQESFLFLIFKQQIFIPDGSSDSSF